MGAFATEPLPKPPSYNEADVSDKPAIIREMPRLNASDEATIAARYRARLESLLAVDDLVERVVNAVETIGALDHTVFIFTSDNGFFHGEHRIKREKVAVYEEASRVPLIIRGGGFPSGAAATQLTVNVDLAPTIVALAGAVPGLVTDGAATCCRSPSRRAGAKAAPS